MARAKPLAIVLFLKTKRLGIVVVSGAGGQGDAFHPGQRGGDGPDDDLGFYEDGDSRRIVRDPHPDIAPAQEEALERHDGEDTDGVELAEWDLDPFRPLERQTKAGV